MKYSVKPLLVLALSGLILVQGCTPAVPPSPTPAPTRAITATPTQIPSKAPSPTLTLRPSPTTTPLPTALPLLHGMAYSPYRDCQSPDSPEQPTVKNIQQDLEIIRGMAEGVRTYGSNGINAEIPALATQMGLRVSIGVALGRDKIVNEKEIQGAVQISKSVKVESIIVGNEVLLRGDLSEDELLAYIQRMKTLVKVPVTYAEIGSVLLGHPRIMQAVDYQMVHLYPFWGGISIEQAAQAVVEEYRAIQSKAQGKRVVIGETGWPSGGSVNGAAVPSLENERRFAREFFALAQAEQIDFYYFGAFDEMWKSEGGIGPYWGLLYADRSFKFTDVRSLNAPAGSLPRSSATASGMKMTVLPSPQTTPQGTAQAALPINRPDSPEFFVFLNFAQPENHFAPGGWMGDLKTLKLNVCWTAGQKWPKSVIQVNYQPSPDDQNKWAGMYWLQPDQNWGIIPKAGFDLSNYKQLVFRARSDAPGTLIKFFVGGVATDSNGKRLPYPSSIIEPIFAQEANPISGFLYLQTEWQEFHINLTGANLSYVIDGFGWVAEQARTPKGATFYLDQIRFIHK